MPISTHKAREILANSSEQLSDSQIKSLIIQLEILAEIFIDSHLNDSKQQLGVIDSKSENIDNNI